MLLAAEIDLASSKLAGQETPKLSASFYLKKNDYS